MKKWKTIVSTALVACMALAAGCGGSKDVAKGGAGKATSKGFYKGKNVTMIVPWVAGGGSDNGARLLVPYLEKELGCTITVTNPSGGSGWVGWNQLLKAKPDGLTVSMINTPPIIAGYLNPAMKRKNTLKDFKFIANHVTDDNVIAINKDEKRFSDMKSMVEYAKTHELTCGTTGIGSDDSVLMIKLNNALGTKFKEAPSKGWADNSAAIQGGHIDVTIANVSEVKNLYENKQLKVLAVFSEKENPMLKGVPVFNSLKLTNKSIVGSSNRGFGVRAGVPDAAFNELAEAFGKAIQNKEQVEKLAKIGLKVDYMGPEKYNQFLLDQEKTLKEMSKLFGWTK